MKNNRRVAGFTLIELLVVVSIIGLLSSIVLSSVKEARNRAIVTKFKEEMRQVIIATALYRETYGRYPDMGQYQNILQPAANGYYVNNLIQSLRNVDLYKGPDLPDVIGSSLIMVDQSRVSYGINNQQDGSNWYTCGLNNSNQVDYVLAIRHKEKYDEYFDDLYQAGNSRYGGDDLNAPSGHGCMEFN